MEELYRLDKNNEPVEGMAESVDISKDKKPTPLNSGMPSGVTATGEGSRL